MGKVTYSIKELSGHEIIWRTFQGDVDTEEIMDSFVHIINEGMISGQCKGILTDLRAANLVFNMETFNNLIIYIKSSPALLNLRIAVVVDTSEKIVFPMIAANETSLSVQPFSTTDAAVAWLIQ